MAMMRADGGRGGAEGGNRVHGMWALGLGGPYGDGKAGRYRGHVWKMNLVTALRVGRGAGGRPYLMSTWPSGGRGQTCWCGWRRSILERKPRKRIPAVRGDSRPQTPLLPAKTAVTSFAVLNNQTLDLQFRRGGSRRGTRWPAEGATLTTPAIDGGRTPRRRPGPRLESKRWRFWGAPRRRGRPRPRGPRPNSSGR